MLLCCDDRYYLTQKLLLGAVEDFQVQQEDIFNPTNKKGLLYFAVNITAAYYS